MATQAQGDALTAHQILALARMHVCQRAPYFRAGVMQLVPRETPGLGTFACTKNWILMWDPAKALEWGVTTTAAVLVHELWHLLRDHFTRFSGPMVNRDLANIAGDLSINPGVIQMGFQLPTSSEGKQQSLMPETFNLPYALTAEQYYEELLKRAKHIQVRFKDGTTATGIGIEIEGCGSCSGRKRNDEPAENDPGGRSESEQRRTRVQIATAIRQQGRGMVPGDLVRWSEETLKPPKIRWQEKLKRCCRAAATYRPGAGHSTYTKLSRRQGGLGFGAGCPVLPSYRATVPRATFLMDTSGSMDKDQIAAAMSEAQGVLSACGARLDFVVCDAAVHGMRTVGSIKEACAMLKGGGGSDFKPAFAEIERRMPKTDIIIAATDGDIDVPLQAPAGIHVIWLLVEQRYSSGSFHRPCNWGTAIEVTSE